MIWAIVRFFAPYLIVLLLGVGGWFAAVNVVSNARIATLESKNARLMSDIAICRVNTSTLRVSLDEQTKQVDAWAAAAMDSEALAEEARERAAQADKVAGAALAKARSRKSQSCTEAAERFEQWVDSVR